MLRKSIYLAFSTFLFFQSSFACTGVLQKAENGEPVYARTMEFGADLVSFDLLFIPRNIAYTSQSKDGQPVKWFTKYAHVGFNPFGMPIVADGVNEKGLAAGAFYFPGWADYQKAESSSNTVSNLDFVSWILGNFANVKEATAALEKTTVVGLVFPNWGIIPPLHYIVADSSGDSAVIEYVAGEMHIYPMPLGTITNAPTYDWHTTNARNYIGLRALNNPSVKISGDELSQFGQGSGSIGLPGDFSPPSRFIRAAFLREVALRGKDGADQVQKTFKILNQFDIPKGAVREKGRDGKIEYEETQWTSAADLAATRYYFHTATSRVIRMVDLKALDANAKEIKSLNVETPETIVDLSSKL